jgi:hypothetical protein
MGNDGLFFLWSTYTCTDPAEEECIVRYMWSAAHFSPGRYMVLISVTVWVDPRPWCGWTDYVCWKKNQLTSPGSQPATLFSIVPQATTLPRGVGRGPTTDAAHEVVRSAPLWSRPCQKAWGPHLRAVPCEHSLMRGGSMVKVECLAP